MSGSTNSSVHDGNLLYMTDNAYFTLLDHESGHRWSPKSKNRQDGLFLERLDSFLEAQQKEIQSFANREQRSLDEIRKLVAIPHARYILSLDPRLPTSDANLCETGQADSSIPSIRSTLGRISSTLQLLHSAAGLDSLLVVVSPRSTPGPNPTDSEDPRVYPTREASWIGGTELGKEFWMGLKGGGVNGARAFRMKCQMRREAELQPLDFHSSVITAAATALHNDAMQASNPVEVRTAKVRSKDVKTELNASVRQALRSISGNPSAEMRWTKPASLEETYNVRLIGWPSTISMRNPSNNTLKENLILLDLVRRGEMRFVTRGSPEWNCSESATQQVATRGDELARFGSSTPLVSGNLRPQSLHSSKASTPMSPIPLQSFEIPPQVSQVQFTSSSRFPYQNPSLTTVSDVDIRHISISPPLTPLQPSSNPLPAPSGVASKRGIEERSEEQETYELCEAKRARFDLEIETE